MIELVVFLMQLVDTCIEGDGERSMINQKRLLMYFKSSCSFKNYAIEMFTWIAQIKSLCCEQMAHRLKWRRFVNWNGGKGNNIACDMAMATSSVNMSSLFSWLEKHKKQIAMGQTDRK